MAEFEKNGYFTMDDGHKSNEFGMKIIGGRRRYYPLKDGESLHSSPAKQSKLNFKKSTLRKNSPKSRRKSPIKIDDTSSEEESSSSDSEIEVQSPPRKKQKI